MNKKDLFNAFANIDDSLVRDSVPETGGNSRKNKSDGSQNGAKVVISVLVTVVLLALGIVAGIVISQQMRSRTGLPATSPGQLVSDPTFTDAETIDPVSTPLSTEDPGDNVDSQTPKRDPFKEQEGAKLAITEPTEEQEQIISVYKQLYPEYKDRQPLLGDTEPMDGEVFFVPPEWYYEGYPAILGRHIFVQIGENWLCSYQQNEEFRLGVFDAEFKLLTDVIASDNTGGSNAVWPCSVFEKEGNYYIAIEFYYGHQGIHSSSTVIYSLPLLDEVWRDSELLVNDPQSEYDQYRFVVNGDWFDIYEFEYHDGWMEPHFKEQILISSVL